MGRQISLGILLVVAAAGATVSCDTRDEKRVEGQADQRLRDNSSGDDWPAYGRSYGEQHYSPLSQVDVSSVERLGLAWFIDLEPGNPVSGPIAVDGVLYTATGYSVVRAVDAVNGKVLWTFDPAVPEVAGKKLRLAWGIRGLCWWNGKLYVGTADGRLIALDAKDGRELWSVMTVGKDDVRFITGAPRAFAGKIIIGHGGADSGPTRGYVTTYDAETGKQLWRFYTVPGDPAKGFEDEAQAMAAKTWSGEWWKHGGGGTVWNTFTYDPETETVFLGTGNGAPWNRRVRSADQGDNLFLSSIVALDAKTGKYKWHYQTNPGESWDYNASMDMQLADLMIGGKNRKVIMQAPKNGFFYVLDRQTGELLAADPIARVTWAKGVDLKTGRPIENPQARYADGQRVEVWPSAHGAHGWLPSAYSPQTKLLYLPVSEASWHYDDRGIDPKTWRHSPFNRVEPGANAGFAAAGTSTLLAWDPVARKPRWRVPTVGVFNGGILATGGNLVFQGQSSGVLTAYQAETGRPLWTFDAKAAVLAPPISYMAGGRQYVTVLTGVGTGLGISSDRLVGPVDYRTQARRILTFALDAKVRLPDAPSVDLAFASDETFKQAPESAARGATLYNASCVFCHGSIGRSGGTAPELARSSLPASQENFKAIVQGGALLPAGMPVFPEFSANELEDVRQYIRTETRRLRDAQPNTPRRGA